MIRIMMVTLVLLAAFDHFSSNGKYTTAALRASSTILHNLRVI
jgi:hypothetical protein